MLEQNKTICIPGEEALEVLKEIEFILISLHKIGSYYSEKDKENYEKATAEFIDKKKVTTRLANIRRIITEKFDTSLGDDDMDDIERHIDGMEFWKPKKS
ncbi:hypothetical protein SB11R_15545 [Pseudomonas oryzihabitans]|nr:hypothetical protein SB11R_15545 [Pseudomonas psychrotolerans]